MRLPTCVGGVAQAEKMQIPGHGVAAGREEPWRWARRSPGEHAGRGPSVGSAGSQALHAWSARGVPSRHPGGPAWGKHGEGEA